MCAVTVGRFHHNIIGVLNIFRILDQGTICGSNISGKYNLALLSPLLRLLRNPKLNGGGTRRCPASTNRAFNPSQQLYDLVIITGNKMRQYPHRIVHVIELVQPPALSCSARLADYAYSALNIPNMRAVLEQKYYKAGLSPLYKKSARGTHDCNKSGSNA